MLDHIPTYKSWEPADVQELFLRYRAIIMEMIASDDYVNYKWLADYCPDLEDRISQMILEKETDRQSRSFNNIVFELQCAIEVLTGKLRCNNPDEWELIRLSKLPRTG